MNFETLLHEEVRSELEELKGMERGSDEYKATIDGLVKLIEKAIEIDKLNIENDKDMHNRDDEQKDRFVKNCIAVAGIIVPSVLTIWGTLKSFEFEKEGTITTIMGRGFINKLLPKK